MTTPDAFLAAIAAAPDDDLPRLVYADWLDENGEGAFAEFVRVQCESAKPYDVHAEIYWRAQLDTPPDVERRTLLRRRERELFHSHKLAWFEPRFGGPAAYLNDIPAGVTGAIAVCRGFPAVVRAPLRVLYGGEPCGGCIATGWAQAGPTVRGASTMRTPVNRCPVCRGKRTTPGVLPALVARWPMVERVEVTDRTAWSDVPDGGRDYGWWDENDFRVRHDGPNDPGNIPTLLFDLIWNANPADRHEDEYGRWITWDEFDIPPAELSTALLAWAKRRDPAPA